jgi:hypothetical protein
MKAVVVVLIAAALGLGGYILVNRPAQIPNLTFVDSAKVGHSLDQIRGKNDTLLMVVLGPQDLTSNYTVKKLNEWFPKYSKFVSFVGLMIGSAETAEAFKQEKAVPFDIYSIQSSTDRQKLDEFITKSGKDYGCAGSTVYTGTIVALNSERYMLFKLEKEQLEELPAKLADLGY